MLTTSQNEPFKFTITTLKKLSISDSIQKQDNHLKSCLQSIREINNLDEMLPLAIDSSSVAQLRRILLKLHFISLSQAQNQKNVTSYENLCSSPSKSRQRGKEMMLKGTKKVDLTPSTKKSRVLSSPPVSQVIEELLDNLQKFDQIKQGAKQIQGLIDEVHAALFVQEKDELEPNEDASLENLWKELGELKTEDSIQSMGYYGQKGEELIELLQKIQNIYKFMEVLRATTDQILTLIEPKGSSETDQESSGSYNMEAVTKKSNRVSEQRSLLTEMLRESSQNSNIELPEHEFVSKVVLRPRFKEYSQNDTSAHLDEQFRFSYKSAKPYQKSQQKLIRSMDYYENEENDENSLPIRRKEVKIKRSEMGCSRCEIF